MPRASTRRKSREIVEDDDDAEDSIVVEKKPKKEQEPRSRSGRYSGSQTTPVASQRDDGDDDDEEEVEVLTLTQQCEPEKSQSFPLPKANERANLENLSEDERQKIITDMGRLVLFKALAGETIDRAKCAKLVATPNVRIMSAVWQEVQTNLANVFGFDLSKPPQYMALPKKYDDRYFCVNALKDDDSGSHSKRIHSIHSDVAIEKGFLMVLLAFVFCKGSPRPGSPSTMRWISDVDLYRLMHGLDDNLPQDPPSVTSRKTLTASSQSTVTDGTTPKIDVLMDKFTTMDYLLKEKVEDSDGSLVYAMGPRAALEIGRKQIIYFCSEILDEEPDPTMLQELEEGEPTQATTQ